MKDYYSILEINESASSEVIEKVHKLLVKKYHPDLQKQEDKKQAEEKMKEINEAYEVLTNPSKRKEYDVKLKEYKIKELEKEIKKDYINQNKKTNNQSNNEKTVKIYNNTSNQNVYLDEEEIRRLAQIYYEELYNQYNGNNRKYYAMSFKDKIKHYIKNIITLIITILVIYIIFKIPYFRNMIIGVLNDNEITKALFGKFFK